MHAVARVEVEAGGRFTVLRGAAPLLPRRTGPGEIHFVGGAAGPLGGDRLRIELSVGPSAFLLVRTVAASIALPGPSGDLSRLEVHASVARGGRLVWLPEPLIATARCRHEVLSTVELAEGAELLWREELIGGRMGEPAGDARLWTSVTRAGRPWYVGELSVGPSAPGWAGPAVLGSARAYASVLSTSDGATGPGIMELAGGGVLGVALGDDLPDVRHALVALCS